MTVPMEMAIWTMALAWGCAWPANWSAQTGIHPEPVAQVPISGMEAKAMASNVLCNSPGLNISHERATAGSVFRLFPTFRLGHLYGDEQCQQGRTCSHAA